MRKYFVPGRFEFSGKVIELRFKGLELRKCLGIPATKAKHKTNAEVGLLPLYRGVVKFDNLVQQ